MDKDNFFENSLKREPDLASASIQSMPVDFRITFYANEQLLELTKKRLFESAVTDQQQELISTLDEIFTWHCTMLANAMFFHGAELMEKEMARKMWLKR